MAKNMAHLKIANAGGEGAGTLSAVTRAGVSNLRHGQAARADRPAQTRERERERSKSIEVGGSRIRKLETPDYQKGVDMLTSLSPNSQSSSFN